MLAWTTYDGETMSHSNRDYYEILQISPEAEKEVIEAAYRRLARKYHPDVNSDPHAPARMRQLNEAFEVLSDPIRRAEYDSTRASSDDSKSDHREPRRHGSGRVNEGRRPIQAKRMLVPAVFLSAAGVVVAILITVSTGGDDQSADAAPTPAFNSALRYCTDTPTPVIARTWQVSAPRGIPNPVRAGEAIELGLRNKFGTNAELYTAGATVIGPAGTASGTAVVGSCEWARIVYPDEFVAARSLTPGVYTVVWEINGGFVACDGFTVQ